MKYHCVWEGTNEIGERIQLLKCLDLDRYAFVRPDYANFTVTFDKQEIGKLFYNLGCYLTEVESGLMKKINVKKEAD